MDLLKKYLRIGIIETKMLIKTVVYLTKNKISDIINIVIKIPFLLKIYKLTEQKWYKTLLKFFIFFIFLT